MPEPLKTDGLSAMTRSDLVSQLAERFSQLTHRDAEFAVKAVVDAMSAALAKGHRIEVRGFGSFCINRRPPRMGRNPRSGDQVPIPEKRVPHFKPGKALREAVDAQGTAPPIAQHKNDGLMQGHQPLVAAVQTQAERLGINALWVLKLAQRYRLSEDLAVRFCNLPGWLNDLHRPSDRTADAVRGTAAVLHALQAELTALYENLVHQVKVQLPKQLVAEESNEAEAVMAQIEQEAAWLTHVNYSPQPPPNSWQTPALLLVEARDLNRQFPAIHSRYQNWMHRAHNSGLPGPDPLSNFPSGLTPPPIVGALLLNDARQITQAYWTNAQSLETLPDFSGLLELVSNPDTRRTYLESWGSPAELQALQFKWSCLVSIRQFLVQLQELNELHFPTDQNLRAEVRARLERAWRTRFNLPDNFQFRADIKQHLYQILHVSVAAKLHSLLGKVAPLLSKPEAQERALLGSQAVMLLIFILQQIPTR